MNNTDDSVVLKVEKDNSKELLRMKKSNHISENLYNKLWSTDSKPARLYCLKKLHKQNIPLQPVLSLPGSSHENLNKILPKLFDKNEGANTETNTQKHERLLRRLN